MQNRVRVVQVNSGDENISAAEYKNAKDQALIESQTALLDQGIAHVLSFSEFFSTIATEIVKYAKGENNRNVVEAAAEQAQNVLDAAQSCLDKLDKNSDAYKELEKQIQARAKKLVEMDERLDEIDNNRKTVVLSTTETQSSPQLPSVTNNQNSFYQSQSSATSTASRTRSEVVTEKKNGGCCVVM